MTSVQIVVMVLAFICSGLLGIISAMADRK